LKPNVRQILLQILKPLLKFVPLLTALPNLEEMYFKIVGSVRCIYVATRIYHFLELVQLGSLLLIQYFNVHLRLSKGVELIVLDLVPTFPVRNLGVLKIKRC
jgi:hypothetical protein